MRVTNTMMTNNAMINMSRNKEVYNKFFQQYCSQTKIQKPSDDPVIAVRSLKYRTRIAELNQYLKNVDDADSWTKATQSVLNTMNGKLTDMFDYCEQAANGTLTTNDRASIKEALKQFVGDIFEQNANEDYAGRYLLTGYRTDVPLLFDTETTNLTYNITENFTASDIYRFSYAYGDAPKYLNTHIMTLSYDNLDKEAIPGDDQDEGNFTIRYKDTSGNWVYVPASSIKVKSVTDEAANGLLPYNDRYNPGEDEIYLIPETGELVFGSAIYAKISESPGIEVDYQKTNFAKNDIRPEHYFDCKSTNNLTGTEKNYSNPGGQDINYQINFSQTLKVNTLACDAVDTSVKRIVDHIVNIIDEISMSEVALKETEKKIADCDPADTAGLEALNQQKEQIKNKITLQETMLTNAYTKAMTVCQEAQDKLNVSIADLGARMNRLESTKAKLDEQSISFEEALSNNDDADLGEAYIRYNQADLLYQATLQASVKILGNSLLDFI